MSKIIFKNFDEIIVSDEMADYVQKEIADKRAKNEFPLSFYAIAVPHDDGLWSGTLNDISSVSNSNKRTTRVRWFSSPESIERFHHDYGYGAFESRYEPGYGVVDVKTQFLIKISKAKFTDIHNKKTLVMLEWKDRNAEQGWSDLWEVYEKNLDPFRELVAPEHRICKITE